MDSHVVSALCNGLDAIGRMSRGAGGPIPCTVTRVVGITTVDHIASTCNPVPCSGVNRSNGVAVPCSARRRMCGTFFGRLSRSVRILARGEGTTLITSTSFICDNGMRG